MIEPSAGEERRRRRRTSRRPAGLAAAAHLVEADGEERRDQREARHEREEQGHHAVAPGHAGQHEADDRIEQAEEDHVGAIGAEILEAAPQHVAQVGRHRCAGPPAPCGRGLPTRLPSCGRPCPWRARSASANPIPIRWGCECVAAWPWASPSVLKGPRAAWLDVQSRSQVTKSREPPLRAVYAGGVEVALKQGSCVFTTFPSRLRTFSPNLRFRESRTFGMLASSQ